MARLIWCSTSRTENQFVHIRWPYAFLTHKARREDSYRLGRCGDYPNALARGPRNGNPQMLVFGAFANKCIINNTKKQATNKTRNNPNNVWSNSNIGLRVSRLSLDNPE